MGTIAPLKDLHLLPKTRDSWSYLYVERCRIEQDGMAVAAHDASGVTPIPCASLTLLMLGPGTTITHAAIHALVDCGCLVAWTGEGGVRFYAQGMGETRSSRRLLRQAALVSHPAARMRVVRRMYERRFPGPLDVALSLRQIRGMEGIRVRRAYEEASRETGVVWTGRSYKRTTWAAADPVNRALSAANSCLYGVVQAAIVSTGYSAALGFIHTGDMRSFVFDIADLYKADLTIPVAFHAVSSGAVDLERSVRQLCRDFFHAARLLDRIVPDIDALMTDPVAVSLAAAPLDEDEPFPGGLWDPEAGEVASGVNYGEPAADGAG